MNKKWLILIIFLIILLVFWQIGGINYLLARTGFAPDYNPSSLEDGNKEDNNENDIDEPSTEEEPTDNSSNEEEILFSTQDIDYEIEIIGEGLEIPREIVPLTDERFLVTERPGRVVMMDSGEKYIVQGVEHIGEGGLLGMEISPNFEENRQLFLYYTYREGNQIFNRVKR